MYFKLIESFVKNRHKFPKSLEIFPCHLIDILMIIFFLNSLSFEAIYFQFNKQVMHMSKYTFKSY